MFDTKSLLQNLYIKQLVQGFKILFIIYTIIQNITSSECKFQSLILINMASKLFHVFQQNALFFMIYVIN